VGASIRLATEGDFAALCTLDTIAQTPKLFTSTNLSNLPMQALLAKLGYSLCGVINELDDNDPELVYVKHLTNES
jgi:hypothetical protein